MIDEWPKNPWQSTWGQNSEWETDHPGTCLTGILTMFLAKTIGIMDHKNPKTLDPVHLQAIHFPKCSLRKLRKIPWQMENQKKNPKLVIMYV